MVYVLFLWVVSKTVYFAKPQGAPSAMFYCTKCLVKQRFVSLHKTELCMQISDEKGQNQITTLLCSTQTISDSKRERESKTCSHQPFQPKLIRLKIWNDISYKENKACFLAPKQFLHYDIIFMTIKHLSHFPQLFVACKKKLIPITAMWKKW